METKNEKPANTEVTTEKVEDFLQLGVFSDYSGLTGFEARIMKLTNTACYRKLFVTKDGARRAARLLIPHAGEQIVGGIDRKKLVDEFSEHLPVDILQDGILKRRVLDAYTQVIEDVLNIITGGHGDADRKGEG